MDWTKEKVVVTGGAGFIGSHLVDVLLARGVGRQNLSVVDDLSRAGARNLHPDVALFPWDLRDSQELPHLARLMEGAVVFHLAARVTNIRENRGDHLGMMQDNLRINANVTEAARWGKPKLLEMTSTVCVYPHDAPVPTAEGAAFPYHPEDTNEGYGLAKAILEKQAEYLHREHGIPVIVPRFANAFGPRDYYDWQSSHVVPAMIRKAHEHDKIVVWGTGRQSRTFLDARDIAETLVRLAEAPAAHDAQPVNIGWGDPIAISDLVWLIFKLADIDKPVTFDTSQPDGHEVRDFCNKRLVSIIGPPPCRPLEGTLADMIAEYQAGEARL